MTTYTISYNQTDSSSDLPFPPIIIPEPGPVIGPFPGSIPGDMFWYDFVSAGDTVVGEVHDGGSGVGFGVFGSAENVTVDSGGYLQISGAGASVAGGRTARGHHTMPVIGTRIEAAAVVGGVLLRATLCDVAKALKVRPCPRLGGWNSFA
jgi:hypothetical protein